MLKRIPFATLVKVSVVTLAVGGGIFAFAQTRHPPRTRPKPSLPPKPIQVQIDFDKAIACSLPEARADLKPAAFKTPDGKEGWVVRIPGSLPIATPAYADGKLFVGGGYGSHEFYAFDARTGEKVWEIKTSDDGPSAAVVEDGCVAFNTESCTVIVADAKTGHLLWQEWLGDPLMSQPAISKGRLYMAYPAGQHGQGALQNSAPNQATNAPAHNTPPILKEGPAASVPHTLSLHGAPAAGQSQPATAQQQTHSTAGQTAQPERETGYKLLCAELKTGHHIWTQNITADVISAPIVEGDQLFFTCFDGTSFCLKAATGAIVWKKQNSGTSAPSIADGQVVMTLKQKHGGKDFEGIQRMDVKKGEARDARPLALSKAEYFQNGQGVALNGKQQMALDSSVGFGGGAPAQAGSASMKANVGINSVAGAWAYQGSRAAYRGGQIMNAQGNALNSLNAKDGHAKWRAEAKGKDISADAQVFSPPALGAQNLYLCTTLGHLLSVNQKNGQVGFLYATKQPMAFQPALAQGNIYVGTTNGQLICLKTGQKDADGWSAWGGNAQHNKKE